MKILDIAVDGFSIWKGLKLEDLSETVTVVYGRNEAGKTTLMQFVRSMLYGLSPERRRRYLPPLDGGQVGGSLRIKTPSGLYVVNRSFSSDHRGDEPFSGDEVTVSDDAGLRQGGHALSVLLSGVDELTYRNVYAVGLREIQELGTLSDTDAARHLYDLSAGLDRVSLVEILRELRASRQRLLASSDQDSEIQQLCQQIKQAQLELDQIHQSQARYRNQTSERLRLAQQIATMEQERVVLESRARVTELSLTLRDKWMAQQDVRRDLNSLGDVPPVTSEDLEQFNQLSEQIAAKQRQQRKSKLHRQQRRDQAAAFPVNEPLRRHGPRIDALAEQRDWILSLDRRIDELDAEIEQGESHCEAQQKKLGIDADADLLSKKERATLLARLKDPARTLINAKGRLEQHAQPEADSPDELPIEADEITVALQARGHADLNSALETVGERVGVLRQRLELDDRLQRLEQQHEELREDHQYLDERQMLPSWGLAAAGFAFALGVMLLLVGIFSLFAGSGWPFVLIGLTLVSGVVVGKFLFEQVGERDLDACERQLEVLAVQIKQARTQRDEWDAELSKGSGPPLHQLREAERELAELEGLLPLQSQQHSARTEVQAALRRADDIRGEYQDAKRDWHRALHEAGLPAKLSPREIRQFIDQCKELAEVQSRNERLREEAQLRRRELGSCVQRVKEMLTDAGFESFSDRLVDQVDQLVRVWGEQQQLIEQRDVVIQESHELRRRQLAVSREIARLQTARRGMLQQAGADSADGYRVIAADYKRSQELMRRQEKLEGELTTALAGVCDEDELATQLDGFTTEQVERRWDNLATRLQQLDDQLKEAFEKRGRLSEQLRALGEDRRVLHKQFELNCLEQQLRDAVSRWQELAVTTHLLDSIRRRYEQERQPATLREASRYLEQLTNGRYRRIWTLFDEDALRVDDADGNALSPEMLSRGTREQLFLSLRLSLVALYAQRGVQLPLVLDDVLVNFDSQRAKAAAAVLGDFAALGHQVLVFTCHEHISEIFAGLKADTRRLPQRGAEPVAVKAKVTEKRLRPKPPSKPPAREVAEPAPEKTQAEEKNPPAAQPPEPVSQPVARPAKPPPVVASPPPPPPQPPRPSPPPVKPEPVKASRPAYDPETTWEADDDELRAAEQYVSGKVDRYVSNDTFDENDVMPDDEDRRDSSSDGFDEAA